MPATQTLNGPIQRVPLELLTRFFVQSTPDVTRWNPGPRISRDHPAVVLSHVCSHWREVVLKTPQLWSTLHIEIPSSEPFESWLLQDWCLQTRRVKDLIEVWIERSAQQPLSVFLNIQAVMFYDIQAQCTALETYTSVLRAILTSSERWRNFEMEAVESQIVLAFDIPQALRGSTASPRLPILESVSLSIILQDGSDDLAPFCCEALQSDLFSSPSLRRVALKNVWNQFQSEDAVMFGGVNPFSAWPDLTELDIGFSLGQGYPLPYTQFGCCQVLDTLKLLPTLVKASFSIYLEEPEREIRRSPPVTMPHLTSLTLRGTPLGPSFGKSVDLPSITSMSLIFDNTLLWSVSEYPQESRRLEEGVVLLIKKFGRQLAQVAINPSNLTLEGLSACLASVQNVSWLSLVGPSFPRTSAPLSRVRSATSQDEIHSEDNPLGKGDEIEASGSSEEDSQSLDGEHGEDTRDALECEGDGQNDPECSSVKSRSDEEPIEPTDPEQKRQFMDQVTLARAIATQGPNTSFPRLQYLEMDIHNYKSDGACEELLQKLIESRRRRVEDFQQSEPVGAGSERWGTPGGGGEGQDSGRTVPCLVDVHVTFARPTQVNILEELDRRGVDMDMEPFNFRLNQPGSSMSLGELSERPWNPLAL